ncbi:MAG: hypothetical protein EBS49_03255 [Verrucomicrobia bacterium]|nr:hypothetical protein [Verrucomicrobiota bacterium]
MRTERGKGVPNLERRTGWEKGKRSGRVETWHENGKKKGVGSFQNGQRDGTFVVWWPNGKKRAETNYRKGIPEGCWTEWDEEGNKLRQAWFQNGKETEGVQDRQS